MKRRLVELGLYATAPLAALVTTPILARALGPEDRGLLGVSVAVCSIAAMVAAWGQAESMLNGLRHNDAHLGASGRVLRLSAPIGAVGALALMILLGVPPLAALVSAVFIPLVAVGAVWRSVAVARQDTTHVAAASGLAATLRVVVIMGLALAGALTLVSSSATLQAALALGTLLALLPSAQRHYRSRPPAHYPRRATPLVGEFRAAMPYVAFGSLTAVTLRADVLVLQVFASPHDVGVYAACAALGQAGLAVSGYFKTRAQATLFSGQGAHATRRELFLAATISSGAVALVAVASEPITSALLGDQFQGATQVLRFVALSSWSVMMLDIVQGLVTAGLSRDKLLNLAAVGAVVTLTCLLVGVPAWGAPAAAAAVAMGASAAVAVGLRMLRRAAFL